MSNSAGMTKSQIDWDLIDSLAEKQGVTYWARCKWRQRNHVPYKWRMHFVATSRGRIKFEHFNEMDKQNQGEAA